MLDIMLPGRNGYEVAERLRQEEVWTPILMLTAKDGEHDEADALDVGADDYLRKPFSWVVLVARLNALLRRQPIERPVELASGDLRLDPGRRTARRGNVELDLTPREFSLLEYLLRHAGQTLSKLEILDHVWSDGFDRDPNVVEVYIGYLGRKGRQALRGAVDRDGAGSRLPTGGHGESAMLTRFSLRARVVAIATVLVALVLATGGWLLASALRTALAADVAQAAALRGQDLGVLAADGALPRPIPIGEADEALVQVIIDGQVVASSKNVAGMQPLQIALPPTGSTRVVPLPTLPISDDGDGDGLTVAGTFVYQWRDKLLESGKAGLARPNSKDVKDTEIAELKKRVALLERTLGKKTYELEVAGELLRDWT